MQSNLTTRASLRRAEEWQHLEGLLVEIRFKGITQRLGRVDTVMPDASGLWLAAHAPDRRTYVDQASGYEVWVTDTEDSSDPIRTPDQA